MPEKDFRQTYFSISMMLRMLSCLKDAERIYGGDIMKRLYCTLMEGNYFLKVNHRARQDMFCERI